MEPNPSSPFRVSWLHPRDRTPQIRNVRQPQVPYPQPPSHGHGHCTEIKQLHVPHHAPSHPARTRSSQAPQAPGTIRRPSTPA